MYQTSDGGASGHIRCRNPTAERRATLEGIAFADIFVKGIVRVVPINLIVPWGVLNAHALSRRFITCDATRLRYRLADLSFYETLGPVQKRIPECLLPDNQPLTLPR